MRIAVLDNDAVLRELIKGTLEQHDHVCHTYADGKSLLDDVRCESFDLLVVDSHWPDMEGHDVVQTVRQISGPQLPILFISRRHGDRDGIEGFAPGADDFMTKPLRMGELVARTSALLRRALPLPMGARVLHSPEFPGDSGATPDANSARVLHPQGPPPRPLCS